MKSKCFTYYQPNDKDIKDTFGDCVIRALTKAENLSWVDVFDELTPIARELQCMPNGKPCYEEFLKRRGYEYVGVSNKRGTKRPTVSSFTLAHRQGVFIARVAHHIVAVVDGRFYDTWDSGQKSLYGYWVKK
ncbi:MAG: hypothetical protein IKO85_05085 [Bacteroidaceae bacterium]|nr:hypothetical protein [Bacteroidaceae bacterium]